MTQNYHLFSTFYKLFPKQNSLLDYRHKPFKPRFKKNCASYTATKFLEALLPHAPSLVHIQTHTEHKYLTFLPFPMNGKK